MRVIGLSTLVVALVAAGAAFAQSQRTTVELAYVGAELSVAIETGCQGTDPTFRIINEGSEWPRLATLEIVRMDTGETVVSRKMRMKPQQNASFRMPSERIGARDFGLRLLPTWYERAVDLDARIACN